MLNILHPDCMMIKREVSNFRQDSHRTSIYFNKVIFYFVLSGDENLSLRNYRFIGWNNKTRMVVGSSSSRFQQLCDTLFRLTLFRVFQSKTETLFPRELSRRFGGISNAWAIFWTLVCLSGSVMLSACTYTKYRPRVQSCVVCMLRAAILKLMQ